MTKRILSLLLLLLTLTFQSQAVLKERDLNRTLHVLRLELYEKWQRQEESRKRMHERNQAQHTNLVNIMKRCQSTSLILYSQGRDFTFDVAYACQQATTLYNELQSKTMPFDEIKANMTNEISRYDSLIVSLQRLPPAIDTAQTSELKDLEHAIRNVRSGAVNENRMPEMAEGTGDAPPMEAVDGQEAEDMSRPFMLDSIGIVDRDSCIVYAEGIRDIVKEQLEKLQMDNEHYIEVTSQVEKLNNYAQQKYTELKKSIFMDAGTDYFTILSRFPVYWRRMKRDFATKYHPLRDTQTVGDHPSPRHRHTKGDRNAPNDSLALSNRSASGDSLAVSGGPVPTDTQAKGDGKASEHKGRPYPSDWRGPIVMAASIFMLIYMLIAAIISNVILRLLVPKKYRSEVFKQKRGVYTILVGTLIFAIAVMVVRSAMRSNLMIMATGLMIEMAWLIAAIYFSMAVRLNGSQCKEGAKIYLPFILMSLIVIWFRIILIPNSLVNLIFPPLLLIFTIWQSFTLKNCRRNVPMSDKIYCGISLAVMLISCVMAWIGYTLMAVQLLVWWMFQLAAIATITCCYDLMEMYERRVLEPRIKGSIGDHMSRAELNASIKNGDLIDKTWLYDFVNRVLVPVCAVFSVVFSLYFAAEIFDLRDLLLKYYYKEISIPSIATFSASKLCLIIALYFVFRYINYVIRSAWFRFRRMRSTEEGKDFNATLARNVIGLLIWGIYVIAVFIMLRVPSTGISVVAAGLSTGMGFASKSLLENFFYGISLMSGRVRVGDYIECDGITGKVESITYQSTQLTTLDGSVVAILNSDLFSKNFKNLTRNHQYELVKIPFGIAYGTNVDEVRQMILSSMKDLETKTPDGRNIVNPNNPISVAFSDFGASSVDLFLIAWVLVDQRPAFTALAKEKIYQVLNENNIEIPFPQQDIYIRSVPNVTPSAAPAAPQS
jgi:small-conductance mechanosensitive channel